MASQLASRDILITRQVVPDHSSWFNRRDLERNISISENHKNMCKFKGDNDPGYKAFSSGLRIYLSEILHSKETQTTRPGVEHDEAQPLQIQCGPAGLYTSLFMCGLERNAVERY